MAKRRLLKKYVDHAMQELTFDIIVSYTFMSEENKEAAKNIIIEVARTRNEFISRISHTEPGNVKGFYKKFHEDFNKKISEFENSLSKLM
ncbi:hypothetical protein [uncultured Bacteroides sp.]|uniref:hypothetical protein n=1 Tax=uncultured Bacteroides sp. TaxID=162156 RepID=UPI002632A568|nr:hypothetical protein [uncultured Bacteroides sp.]